MVTVIRMKLLYGVVGEGMGHAMRSSVVLKHLLDVENHEIEIMASSKAAEFLADRFKGVTRIHGLHMIAEDNRVRRGKTLWSNILEGTKQLPGNVAAYYALLDRFKPEAVISDFESWSIPLRKEPSHSGDQHRQHADHQPLQPSQGSAGRRNRTAYALTKTFVKSKLPFCDHYLITTFFHPDRSTTRTPACIRRSCGRRSWAPRPPVAIICSSTRPRAGYDELVEALESSGIECRIYGVRRDLEEEQVEGNLRYRPFSEQGFIDDLASARAVVAGAGLHAHG